MMNISQKRWPSGSGLQTTVSALFDLIAEHDVVPEDITEVRVIIPEHAYRAHGTMDWDDKFKAMLSARFLTSVVLHDRNCWTDQFEDGRRLDPVVDRFARDKVEVSADEALTSSAARTEIQLRDGSVLTDFREAPKGDPSDPLTISEVVSKYRDSVDESTFNATIDQLTDLAAVPDVGPLIRLLGVSNGGDRQ